MKEKEEEKKGEMKVISLEEVEAIVELGDTEDAIISFNDALEIVKDGVSESEFVRNNYFIEINSEFKTAMARVIRKSPIMSQEAKQIYKALDAATNNYIDKFIG